VIGVIAFLQPHSRPRLCPVAVLRLSRADADESARDSVRTAVNGTIGPPGPARTPGQAADPGALAGATNPTHRERVGCLGASACRAETARSRTYQETP